MSSVLKALKNQSSPLIQGSSEVHLSSARVASSGISRGLLWLFVVVAAVLAGWFIVQWYMASSVYLESTTAAQPIEQQNLASAEQQYRLGDMAVIKTPQWPRQELQNTSIEKPIRSSAEQQQNQSPVNDNQAIDLSQISPELLSAFESALAEGVDDETNNNLTRSVVPELKQLDSTFRRTVPSFTYDGHQYSSRPQGRWVELNGIRLFEGERFEGVTVLTIAPAHVVLVKDNQAFSQPALEDWTKP